MAGDFAAAGVLDSLNVALDALLAVLERQRGLAGEAGADRVSDAWRAVFLDGSGWRAALR